MKNVLVFAPHPDDDIIGCGGSIAKHCQRGNQLTIAYLTSGNAGSISYTANELGEVRELEAQKAANLLGVNDLVYLRIPDGSIAYSLDNLKLIIKVIRSRKPDIVYTPHSREAVNDHSITFQLVREACSKASGPWFADCQDTPWTCNIILAYEVWTPLQDVSYAEDITEFMELKVNALKYHESQLKSIKYDEAVTGINRYRGILTGRGQYCEAFQVIQAGEIL